MSANRHSQFNHITLKKRYTNQRHVWQRNIIPQLQLITHTSSPCIPFTYLNKGRGICQEEKYRLVRHARQQAGVSVRMSACTAHAEMWLKKIGPDQIGCWYLLETDGYRKPTLFLDHIYIWLPLFFITDVLSCFASCWFRHTCRLQRCKSISTFERRSKQTLCVCVFLFLLLLLHYFYLLFLCLSFIMARGRLEIKEASIGRQSERSHSVMLSATHNALQVDVWHVLYIFPLWRSLNKCPLMYSSQEMNFYLCGLGTCSLSVPASSMISWACEQDTHTHTNVKSKNKDNKCGHDHAHHAHTCYVLPQGSWGCVCWYDR